MWHLLDFFIAFFPVLEEVAVFFTFKGRDEFDPMSGPKYIEFREQSPSLAFAAGCYVSSIGQTKTLDLNRFERDL